MNCIAADKPKYPLVSMSLAEQCSRVAEIARTMQMLSPSVRPRIIVGGYAVKAGLRSGLSNTRYADWLAVVPKMFASSHDVYLRV
jgi:hypothetical protein